MKHLLEMGFEEKDVIAALRVTRNDGNAAVRLQYEPRCEKTVVGVSDLSDTNHLYKNRRWLQV